MKSSEIVNKISEVIDKGIPPPPLNDVVIKDTIEKTLIEEIISEIVNKVSENSDKRN